MTQTNPSTDLVFQQWIKKGLNASILFKPLPKLLRLIRRIWLTYNFPFSIIWLNCWIKDIKKYDCFIVHASEMTGTVATWIHRFNPSARIIYWYWNPVNKYSNPSRVKDKSVEFWTFNNIDAQKYCMRTNIQYYSGLNVVKSKNKYDVYFIGHDKGRKEQINNIIFSLRKKSLICKVDLITPDKKNLPYKEVCKRISESKAILEINQSGQDGYTLRTMEALFFKKKLITNNINIKKEQFYFKDNIFILGIDSMKDICSFINKPYDKNADKYIKDHDINKWFNNFFV